MHLVGVDEETAIVGGPRAWSVMGSGAAWILDASGELVKHEDGAVLTLPGRPDG